MNIENYWILKIKIILYNIKSQQEQITDSICESWAVARTYGQCLGIMGSSQDLCAVSGDKKLPDNQVKGVLLKGGLD